MNKHSILYIAVSGLFGLLVGVGLGYWRGYHSVAEKLELQIHENVSVRNEIAELQGKLDSKDLTIQEYMNKNLEQVQTISNLRNAEIAIQKAQQETMQARLEARQEKAKTDRLLDNTLWSLTPAQAAEKAEDAARVAKIPPTRTIFIHESHKPLEFALIPAGPFTMGSPITEVGRDHLEFLHEVEIQNSFYMSKYQITQGQWYAVTGERPSKFGSGAAAKDRPVENISWQDIMTKFLPKLKQFAPRDWAFRLPTEAEWEYAFRSGSPLPWVGHPDISALDSLAWHKGNSAGTTNVVGMKSPNAWGLYDMLGNVNELCLDAFDPMWYTKSPRGSPFAELSLSAMRVCRGGSFATEWSVRQEPGTQRLRAAYRNRINANDKNEAVGFRLVLVRSNDSVLQQIANMRDFSAVPPPPVP